ncbi:MAG: hypothetical protein ACI36T_00400 [Eggerthellaceae bacterium]
MDESELRKQVLGGKKTDRLVFAVTPEMKAAMEKVAEEECTSVSAILTALATEKVLEYRTLFAEKGN